MQIPTTISHWSSVLQTSAPVHDGGSNRDSGRLILHLHTMAVPIDRGRLIGDFNSLVTSAKGGYVFASVCLFVFLSVYTIT